MKIDPTATAKMLIRRPVNEVFDSFVDPEVTSRFWFTRSSGKLEQGKSVIWYWDMYGFSAEVDVKIIEENRRIVIDWQNSVEWLFEPRKQTATIVTITSSGFTGTDDEQVAKAIDSMGGFCFCLAGCKAFLEHGIELNLTGDHNPDARAE